jgi:hypothetical protein
MELSIDHNSDRNKQIDKFESIMLENFPQVEAPVRNFFGGGVYVREMTAYKGSIVTSLIHRTEHLFIVSKGKLNVSVDNGEVVTIEAPYIGLTKPGTRRVAYVVEECTWSTIHRTDIVPKDDSEEAIEEAVNLIGEQIIEPHVNSELGGYLKNNKLLNTLK